MMNNCPGIILAGHGNRSRLRKKVQVFAEIIGRIVMRTMENEYIRVGLEDRGAQLCSLYDKVRQR